MRDIALVRVVEMATARSATAMCWITVIISLLILKASRWQDASRINESPKSDEIRPKTANAIQQYLSAVLSIPNFGSSKSLHVHVTMMLQAYQKLIQKVDVEHVR